MERITTIDPDQASGQTQALIAETKKQLGRTPNLYLSMAQSPAALQGYLGFRSALTQGILSDQMRERIALLTATINDCDYCVAAHCFRGSKLTGLSERELAETQSRDSADPKVKAGLQFVAALIETKGRVSDEQFAAARNAGWTDAGIGEIVANVALNIFSNYFNHVARPELDFPAAATQ